MSIRVRYFASLRERLGRAGDEIARDSGVRTAADVWARAAGGQPLPDNTLVAINMEYASLDREVHEGDEVAFFPPVTGG
ncbi:molybdopterin converting factor [Sulfurifustis variabilis]|uniref:Molybdopterin converting factor n=1 Tax=Sulfurifustis variabilis TaxID=1675686 RepID=A0A1B4V5T2_9GAMM|nr:MoaD/ThiS family protein [Sulfurifustis variabilis]BAU48878.1 molybdopterin converting factor [Sulfurifustis variabilis]